MSDPVNHDPLSDDLFRNRIAAALRELDQPESDADIAAALDAVGTEPLSDAAMRRILRQVRSSISATSTRDRAGDGGRIEHSRSGVVSQSPAHQRRAGHGPAHRAGITLRPASPMAQVSIVAACVAVLVVIGISMSQFGDVNRVPLVARNGVAQPRPGELISSSSTGRRHSAQTAAVAPVHRVTLGETLSTGPREKRRVTLPDGSILSINEQTRVTVVARRRVKLLAGEVFVEVVPAGLLRPGDAISANDLFVVETPQRTVTALGTKFVVKAQGRATNVVVTQGTVRVSGVDEVIPAGRELIADLTESRSVELRPAKRSAYVVEWVKDLMAAAGSVVVPASAHSGGSVTVVDPNGQEMKLSLRKFHVDVHIEDGFARTTIDQTYFNHTWQQLEGTFRFPLPADASLSRLAMYVNGKLMEGGMVERDYGRNVFEQIRHTKRDPALLEWVDGSTFQMRVFPLEPRQEKRIVLSYTQRLPGDYGKSVYRFPAGHSLDGVREWSTALRVKGAAGTKWYSPSHPLNGRDDHGDLLIDGRDEHAALDRDLVVELGEPEGASPRFSEANRGLAPNVTDFGQVTRSVNDGIAGNDPSRSPSLTRRVGEVSAIGLAPSRSGGAAMWSICEQDGFQYVMLRQRPELKATAERSPRQWIFLVENSADRNEVLAGTQRQIAKTLLENAEHSDTFSIIRAGTQADLFRRKPVECSLENVAAALQFLNDVAPIGALDLEQALQAVQKQVRGDRDVWIVHLGTGIPVLGERHNNTLLRLLPAHARYVGVAVGKRWSKSFMETAASHSGGHITQINPDEAVAWRAFDLLSTLNAPRLTEIAVHGTVTRSVSEGESPKEDTSGSDFLLLTKSLAHGQELAAVARFAKGQALPKSVTITGKLNGKAYSKTVELPGNSISRRALAPGSDARSEREPDASAFRLIPRVGHLPRTWARLEIDRLVALGAAEHKPQIIELSKSMYVMSPFTSLLVLETEAMYEQFKVDRGRKDHWAMYPAPAEIPVIADQGPSQLSPLDAAKERLKLSQARVKTAQANYERSIAEKRPANDLQRLERLNRAEQAEVRLIEREVHRIERANAAAADPVRIAWESVVQRRSVWQQVYHQASPNHWNYWGRQNVWDDWSNGGNLMLGDLGLDGMEDDSTISEFVRPVDEFIHYSLNSSGPVRWGENGTRLTRLSLDLSGNESSMRSLGWQSQGRMALDGISATHNFSTLGLSMFGEERDVRVKLRILATDRLLGTRIARPMIRLLDSSAVEFEELAQPDLSFTVLQPNVRVVPIGRGFGTVASQPQNWSAENRLLTESDFTAKDVTWSLQGLPRSGPALIDRLALGSFHGNGIFIGNSIDEVASAVFDNNGDGISDDVLSFNLEPGLAVTDGRLNRFHQRLLGERRFSVAVNGGSVAPEFAKGFRYVDGGYFLQPGLAVHRLTGVLQDLPSYAPGLQTWPADRLAIVEQASATKPQRGEVDAAARRLIEKARSLGWEKVRLISRNALASGSDRDKPDASTFRLIDGSGRFVFEREVAEGLREQVIHDGSTLWHLYPEIGLAAKRSVSRFHQSAIQSLIPWYVPSADDLNVDADLKSVGERTVRITRLVRTEPVAELARVRKDGESNRILANPATDTPHQTAFELVFAEDGRLVETRVVDVTANKRLAEQTFSADGTIRLLDAEDKLIGETKYERQPIEAPNLVPVTTDLVVLPLPYRSAAGVPVSVPVNLQTNAPDFVKLSDDDALRLLATYFAEVRANELVAFIDQRYTARGDHRIGLAVLLASVSPHSPLVLNATKQHPDAPLAKYLEQFASFVTHGQMKERLDPLDGAGPFLKRLVATYNVHSRWARNQVATPERTAAEIEQDVEASLLVIRDCRSVDLAAMLLSTVSHGLKQANRMNAALARKLNDTAVALSDERGLPAFGRTARIDWLLTVGDDASVAQAKKLFQTQLADAIAIGDVPDLNGETRGAFVKHFQTAVGQPCVPWGELVREAARQLAAQKRPHSLMVLARACVSLGEPGLAAEVFQLAIKDQDLAAHPRLNLAALAYAKEAANWEQAEVCVQHALANDKLRNVSQLWRDAANIAHHLRKFGEWIESLEHAYELEFAALPKTVNLEAFRQDYDSLFTALDERAQQLAGANLFTRIQFARTVQRAATRWRDIDVDDTAACHRTARMLTKLGLAPAAWNYWTTPLAETPDQSSVWVTFATAMNSEQRFLIADRAWATAFECEPTNPELLLQHAQFLRTTGQEHRARELLTKIINRNWQPRFEGTKNQARTLLTVSP